MPIDVINIDIDALPINRNESVIRSSTLTTGQRTMLSEYHMDKLSAALLIPQIIPKFEALKKFNWTKIAKDLKDFGICIV